MVTLAASLTSAPSPTALNTFNHAEHSFIHGDLEEAQRDAERGYRRFLYSDPPLARKFQLLEANAMAWRGLNEGVLSLLSDDRIAWSDADDRIQQLALEATALTYLHRLGEADDTLAKADELCLRSRSSQCGAVLRAHGIFHFERGETAKAAEFFLETLKIARASKDGLLEGTALLNLGHTASQDERHEEALAYYRSSAKKATELGANDLKQGAIGNGGWEQYSLGNSEMALEVFGDAEKAAASSGDVGDEIVWIIASASVYADRGQMALAEQSDLRAMSVAKQFNSKEGMVNASEDLSQVYIYEVRPDDADRLASEVLVLSQQNGSKPDILYCHMIQGEAAALRNQWIRAESLLKEVAVAPDIQTRMKWTAQHTLATSYEAQGRPVASEQAFKAAIALVEDARANLKQELSQLTFLNNATRIYDDYIHFLIAKGRPDEALEAADWSRARTLQQGLRLISVSASTKPPPLRASAIARATNSTLLFYWLGEKQSYLWAVTPEKTTLVTLPAKGEIVAKMQRYRRTLMALKDPLRANEGLGDTDGRELYATLIAPAAAALSPGRPVVLFTDGEMTQLNFETLIASSPTPHYWIEDATVSSSPSIRLFASKNRSAGLSASAGQDKLLLMGDSAPADRTYINLPLAAFEVEKVKNKFRPSDEVTFSGAQATPLTYLSSKPEQFSYIHFVAHATASTADPLESAVILSRDSKDEDSYKLYAREILKHPISARLVTISACNSSGSQFYAGEGVVGLSWAFLRAGAHNTIGALWEVSDASTPELMDHLYAGLQEHQPPATALRNAKLSLLRSNGNFSRPFYWAPFQLYSGR